MYGSLEKLLKVSQTSSTSLSFSLNSVRIELFGPRPAIVIAIAIVIEGGEEVSWHQNWYWQHLRAHSVLPFKWCVMMSIRPRSVSTSVVALVLMFSRVLPQYGSSGDCCAALLPFSFLLYALPRRHQSFPSMVRQMDDICTLSSAMPYCETSMLPTDDMLWTEISRQWWYLVLTTHVGQIQREDEWECVEGQVWGDNINDHR